MLAGAGAGAGEQQVGAGTQTQVERLLESEEEREEWSWLVWGRLLASLFISAPGFSPFSGQKALYRHGVRYKSGKVDPTALLD